MRGIIKTLISSFLLMLTLSILLGGVYPLLVTALAQSFFQHRANGSLIERGGSVLGSNLLGQSFESPKYFWGRLSATDPAYNAAASGGSNFNPANPKLLQAANLRIAALQKADPGNTQPVPVDLVTASASGLDPHISLQAVLYQAHRVALTRGITDKAMADLIAQNTETPLFGLGGPPYVNVLRLNLALDDMGSIRSRDKK